MKRCPRCQQTYRDGVYCPNCGEALMDISPRNNRRKRDTQAEQWQTRPNPQNPNREVQRGKILWLPIVIVVIVIIIVFIVAAGIYSMMGTKNTSQNMDSSQPLQNMETDTENAGLLANETEAGEEQSASVADEIQQTSAAVDMLEAETEKMTEKATEKATEAAQSEYILPGSDSRYLSKSDLEGLTKEQCRLARNELYARHGRKFDDQTLMDYFSQFSWYHPTVEPDDFQESMLNKYEIANRDLIVAYEKEKGYR